MSESILKEQILECRSCGSKWGDKLANKAQIMARLWSVRYASDQRRRLKTVKYCKLPTGIA